MNSTILLGEYTTIVALMMLLPLLPAWMGIREKKDFKPLKINFNYAHDPRSNVKSFDRCFKDDFNEANIHDGALLKGKKLGDLKVLGSHFKEKVYPELIYVTQEATVPENTLFEQELISKENLTLSSGCHAKAIKAERKLTLGSKCCISRWVDAENSLHIGKSTHLNIASSLSSIYMEKEVTFSRLYGHPIITSSMLAYKKDLLFVYEEDPEEANIEKVLLYIQDTTYEIKENDTITQSIVLSGKLVMGAGAKILGDIKANDNVLIGDNCIVNGNIIAEGNITIGKNCFVSGNIFSRKNITVNSYTQVGTEKHTRSIVAKNKILLQAHVAVFNYIKTYEEGKVI